MKAIVTTTFGKPPQTNIEEREKPVIKPGYSIVKIQAATINQLSKFIREGDIPEREANIVLGNEGSGYIEESNSFQKGTRVGIYGGNKLGITEDGLFQEWVLVEDNRLFPLPDALSWDEGATLSVNYLTAYRALTQAVNVKEGQVVLVSGATGSVGNAVIQVGNALGLKTIGIVSTTKKMQRAKEAGASFVIDLSTTQDFKAEILKLTNGKGADYAFDPVGGEVLSQLVTGLSFRGTLVLLGFAGGMKTSLPALDIIANEKKIIGYALHAEHDDDVIKPLKELVQLAATGKIKPIIDSKYSIDKYEDGYKKLASREAIGSIVLNF